MPDAFDRDESAPLPFRKRCAGCELFRILEEDGYCWTCLHGPAVPKVEPAKLYRAIVWHPSGDPSMAAVYSPVTMVGADKIERMWQPFRVTVEEIK
jgi:hypothetical protein